jgi:starvation-inducible DNA-binding protein
MINTSSKETIMLVDNLKVLLGSTFMEYTKIHGFHFNVEGRDFPQYHKFLKKYYEEVYATIDPIGEYIRTLDSYTPGCVSRMMELSAIQDQPKIPRAELMFAELLQDSEIMINLAEQIFNEAADARQQGISNYMATLQDLYGAKRWMINSILKRDRE